MNFIFIIVCLGFPLLFPTTSSTNRLFQLPQQSPASHDVNVLIKEEALAAARFHDPSEKSHLPQASDSAMYNQTAWSTYRSQLYFGLKNRRPDSPVFGLMWYRQGTTKSATTLPLRHWAKHEDNVVFMWNQHDGRSFGSQQITDADFAMRTDWFNFGSSSWMARLQLEGPWAEEANTNEEQQQKMAILFYVALQDTASQLFQGNIEKQGEEDEIHWLNGQNPAVGDGGKFTLTVRVSEGDGVDASVSKISLHAEPFVDLARVGELVKSSLVLQSDVKTFAFEARPQEEQLNFMALQITVKKNTAIELLFQLDSDKAMAPAGFADGFKERETSFQANFERIFPISKDFPPIYHKMGQSALSNVLGGIGVWHGQCWMRSKEFRPPLSVKPYGPHSLLSAVPARTGFPRGFVWDEGHHNLLIHKFDPSLSVEIIGAYLDMMNVDGWIPREIVLGSESEARIPAEALVQEDWVGNPPAFFLWLREFMDNRERLDQFRPQLRRLYPRMKQLYLWLRDSQRGPLPGTFRWHARNFTTQLELNPRTLDSGLDDSPRASHPSTAEYHVDLLCWMAMASSVLEKLAQIAGDLPFLPSIHREAVQLNDVDMLDRYHWSERAQQYCDYGLHSDSVDLVPVQTAQQQQQDGAVFADEIQLVRRVLVPPRYQFVENVNGYVNLFPLLMRLLPPESPRMGALLRHIGDPQQLWSPYGLRSLATWSPYYMSWNFKNSAPYWRGQIWINLNYYAITALKYYASLEGPYKEECTRLHAELRTNLLRNMAEQYQKTGYIWEHYNDLDGHGAGMHPFTGWSALVLAVLVDN